MLKTILYFSFFLGVFFSKDGVAAVVGDEIILESAVSEQVAAFLTNVDAGADVEVVRDRVLDYLIEQEVLAFFAKKDTLIMHPGPMNRGVEIDTRLADDINVSLVKEQVELGVAVRMACLKLYCK